MRAVHTPSEFRRFLSVLLAPVDGDSYEKQADQAKSDHQQTSQCRRSVTYGESCDGEWQRKDRRKNFRVGKVDVEVRFHGVGP